MNFLQPQRRPSSQYSPGGREEIAPRKSRGRKKINESPRVIRSKGEDPLRCINHAPPPDFEEETMNNEYATNNFRRDRHHRPSMRKADYGNGTKKYSDPPIFNYDGPNDDNGNDAGSTSSDTSQRARRRQLREIAAQLDDCWEANLSDDDGNGGEALPLEWNSSMVRRQMLRGKNRKNRVEEDYSESGSNVMLPGINMQHGTSTTSENSNGRSDEPLSNNGESGEMSLPEQLLQKRLMRKKRSHRKHEQFVRYRKQSYQQGGGGGEKQSSCTTANNVPITPPAHKKNSVSHLIGTNGEIPRAASPLFSDDEFDDDNASTVASSKASNEYSHYFPSTHKKTREQDESDQNDGAEPPASPLLSLPQIPICPFPDEADRKRIVGCLAGILASSYAYETGPHLLVKEKKVVGKGRPIPKDVLRKDEDPEASIDEAVSVEIQEALTEESASFDGSVHDRDNYGEADHEPSWNTSNDATAHPHLHTHENQKHIIQQSRESQLQRPPTPFDNFAAAFQKNKTPLKSNSSVADLPPRKSAPNTMNSLQQSFSFASFNNNNSAARMFEMPGSQNPPPSLTIELAEIRHRIRRHAILSELLVSSAEMLLLDPSHAKAFLPMLEGLLTTVEESPRNTKENNMDRSGHSVSSRESWKGRGSGGGGVPNADFSDRNNSTSSTHPASSMAHGSSQTTEPEGVITDLPSPNEGPAKSNSALKSISEDVSTPRKMKGMYKPSTQSFPSPSNQPYAPLDTAIVEKELVAPFLQTLTPGAGFRCIALLLLNHLLRDGRGYDARVRQAFKRLAVIVISHELKVGGILRMDLDDEEGLDALLRGDGVSQQNSSYEEESGFNDADELAFLATRKFEAMEHAIAAKLISMSGNSKDSSAGKNTGTTQTAESRRKAKKTNSHGRIALAPKQITSQHGVTKEQLLRGLKVGTAGALGATLFALTGGLAAPGIAAGLAAVAGTSAIAAGVTTVFSSAAAISTIFGVGGAGLASYKMHRRTKGLTEFNFNKESVPGKDTGAELFSTVCISGWLRDSRDFQRPWGVSPSHPRIIDKQELLERFYFIHNPSNVFRVSEILKHWKGRYLHLWRALRQKYGRDPSNLFPLEEGPRIGAELTHEEGEAVDFLLDELGYFPKKEHSEKPSLFRMEQDDIDGTKGAFTAQPKGTPPPAAKELQSAQKQLKDSSMKPKKWLPEGFSVNSSEIASNLSLFSESETSSINDTSTHTVGSVQNASSKGPEQATDLGKNPPPKHLLTVWDYHANYGGELYTVQWESELLMELCDSVTDLMIDWGISATKTILHTTVFATLMVAVTLPYSLVLAANTIDSAWTMAMERADRAGVELAKSLIDSTAGHRPVILTGFSMGARVIYACLKELARHQEIWEAHQQKKKLPSTKQRSSAKEGEKGEDKLKYVREPASIVEDAILMGTPNHVSLKSWEACRRVVAGRIINCYSRKDLILSLMFQLKRFQGILKPVCGTSPVAVNGVENYDVTDLVSAHTDYCLVSGEIMKKVMFGQPQRASVSKTEVSAMVTTINVANKDIGGFAALSDEKAGARE
mmetsp:Transcript_19441/g.36305  ORF Transcript_19441/g.36305 Transcript_19441/m.36305 type:complete len:1551 (-) Transcript_19441:468-5120(-)